MKKILTTILCATALLSATATTENNHPADTNGDGIVNINDAHLIYSYILGTADESIILEQVDVNNDGTANTADVVEVYASIITIGDVNVKDWEEIPEINGGEATEE